MNIRSKVLAFPVLTEASLKQDDPTTAALSFAITPGTFHEVLDYAMSRIVDHIESTVGSGFDENGFSYVEKEITRSSKRLIELAWAMRDAPHDKKAGRRLQDWYFKKYVPF